MNRRVSQLDPYTLISNSDAHSPIKLGRECTRFRGEPDFYLIRRALESRDPDAFLGTVEFYPEEGKYHYDGHRKCDLRLEPEETRSHSGICPKCGKPLTLGVLYRVEEQMAWLLGRTKIITETPVDEFISEITASVGPDDSGRGNGFLTGLAMQTDTDLVNRNAEKVSLLSMHAAKGLEFPVVFISGCEAGLIPHAPVGRQSNDPDEERRLFYVAMTRAQSHLLLTWTNRRHLYGRMTDREPSPFVKDIDVHLKQALESSKGKHQTQKPAQLGLFV